MTPPTQTLPTRSFLWLNTTQFLGALNDNLFKLLLIFFLIDLQGPDSAGAVAATVGGVFVLPFLLFSPVAGILADRVPKSRIIKASKALEVLVMGVGTLALLMASPAGLYLSLFLMALQSTFFSPAKYGIVPELVEREGLSRANGLLEAFTYLAIILGTSAATLLPLVTGDRYHVAGLICLAISACGLLSSSRVRERTPVAPSQVKTVHPWKEIRSALLHVCQDRPLGLAVFGSALFMFVGAFVQLNLIPLGIQMYGLSPETSGSLFLLAAIGIGGGSLLAGRLSGRNVELGVVPIGATLLSLAAFGLGTTADSLAIIIVAILTLGVGAGLFIVPLHAFIQFRAPEQARGRILAVVNFLGWSGVLAAAGLTHLTNVSLELPAQLGFLGLGLVLALTTLMALVILPDFLVRFIALIAMKLIYRVRTSGNDNIPVSGGALLVANHVSWLDSLLLLATQQRRIRFLMEREIYQTHRCRALFKLMGVIPISSSDNRKQLIESLKAARQSLDDGYLVCIFAEGALTRNGTIQEFRPGFERIVRGSEHPVIPVHIGGIWGSIFSYKHGPLLSTLPKAWPEHVVISIGTPMPPTTSAMEVRQAVMQLSNDYFEFRKGASRTLARQFVHSARKHWRQPAMADTSGITLRYGETLISTLALREALEPDLGEGPVGILLPPSAAGALTNLAVTLSGRVAVNLNYSASEQAIYSALEQAGIKSVLTSARFLAKLDLRLGDTRCLDVANYLKPLSTRQKLSGWLKARYLPTSRLLPQIPVGPDALATIIFSSGSTSEPKGVMLSHHNILSNIEALNMLFTIVPTDNLCGILPFFHSFGYTGTLWLPLLTGFSATYHANPLESRQVARMIRQHRSTFLLATPSFLATYLRKATPDDFRTLRVVITGAEKLSPALATAFQEKYGLAPLEGYGATELSPVAALSLPDVEIGRARQTGSQPESVGRPLPGVTIRIIDPETGQPLGPDQQGLIQISGPNVMRGYFNQEALTNKAIQDGWYNTGDLGSLDNSGFLTISGRQSRFSKIAGEMVPHGALEEVYSQGLCSTEPQVAVTSVPDPKRGERIVTIYQSSCGKLEVLRALMDNSDLPNLWKPSADSYLAVERLPLLGSGKLDLRALKGMAEKAFCKETRPGESPC